MTLLTRLASALKLPSPADVEDVLRNDEQRARATVRITRRGLLTGVAAMVAAPVVPGVMVESSYDLDFSGVSGVKRAIERTFREYERIGLLVGSAEAALSKLQMGVLKLNYELKLPPTGVITWEVSR